MMNRKSLSCPQCENFSFIVRIKRYGGAMQIIFLCDNCGNEIEWLVKSGGMEEQALKRFFEKKEK